MGPSCLMIDLIMVTTMQTVRIAAFMISALIGLELTSVQWTLTGLLAYIGNSYPYLGIGHWTAPGALEWI